jgi:hypothetical protein
MALASRSFDRVGAACLLALGAAVVDPAAAGAAP